MILIDTSVFATSDLMTTERFKKDETAKEWTFCEKCELIVPPRSWHCTTCKTCILKRDHHCMFASNCIGYYNQRYFIAFLIYFFIATTYCVFYNSYYIWIVNGFKYINLMTPLKMLFPMFMIFLNEFEITLFIYMLLLIGSGFSGVLLIYHGKLIARNATTHERNKGAFDMGLTENLKIVFGEKPFHTILWPFTKSTLPETYWNTAESDKSK
jgi:palmitoyltransferase